MRWHHWKPMLIRLAGLLSGLCTAQLLVTRPAKPALQAAMHDNVSNGQLFGQESPPKQDFNFGANHPRILCIILTHPKQYASMAVRVNNTWARRCSKYYFIGSQPTNVSIPLILLPLRESRRILWKKVRLAFQAVHAQERIEDFDYFLKADDDTFVVMENLRSLLSQHNPNEAVMFGRRFAYQGDPQKQYMSGGAGYVLSRRAFQLLISEGFGGTRAPGITDYCNIDYITVEDYLMGRCLSLLGVKFGNSLDEAKRERFHPLRPESMVNPQQILSWLKQYNFHPFERCVTCISNSSISFHYVEDILEMEFLLYHIRLSRAAKLSS